MPRTIITPSDETEKVTNLAEVEKSTVNISYEQLKKLVTDLEKKPLKPKGFLTANKFNEKLRSG